MTDYDAYGWRSLNQPKTPKTRNENMGAPSCCGGDSGLSGFPMGMDPMMMSPLNQYMPFSAPMGSQNYPHMGCGGSHMGCGGCPVYHEPNPLLKYIWYVWMYMQHHEHAYHHEHEHEHGHSHEHHHE